MPETPNKGELKWPEAIQNVIVTAMQNGYLPILILPGLAGFVFWLVPADDRGQTLEKLAQSSTFGLLGWAFAVFVSIGWAIHYRIVKGSYEAELKAMSDERNQAQKHSIPPTAVLGSTQENLT